MTHRPEEPRFRQFKFYSVPLLAQLLHGSCMDETSTPMLDVGESLASMKATSFSENSVAKAWVLENALAISAREISSSIMPVIAGVRQLVCPTAVW